MRTIPLTNSDGQVVLVDDADYPELSRYVWRIRCGDHQCRAVVQADSGKAPIYLHNVIMNPAPGLPVIHIDGDYHNCQRDNLYVPEPKTRSRPTHPHTCFTLDGQNATEVVRDWLSFGQPNWSAATSQQYTRAIGQFFTFLAARDNKPADPAKLTISDVAQFLSHTLKGHGHNTANSYRTGLKSFFTWRTKHYGADNIGAAIPMFKPEPPKQRILTEDEYHTVLDTAEPIERDVIQFLANTGLKRAEFLGLKWSHVTTDMASIRFRDRGKRERVIPLNAVARSILKKYQGQGDAIPFVTRYSHASTINRLCQRATQRAGIPAFDLCALRHFFSIRLIKADVSIQKLSKILGHNSIRATEILYAHLWLNDLAGVTDVLTD